ncbi:hypothetical protein GCM10029992_07840 [Glycomyces albus]
MTAGLVEVTNSDLDDALEEVILVRLVDLLNNRGEGHCMRMPDLEAPLAVQLCRRLRTAVPRVTAKVLGEPPRIPIDVAATSTKLVELRNPAADGTLRPPLLAFIPPGATTSAEDSFGAATFEEIGLDGVYGDLEERLRRSVPGELRQSVNELFFALDEEAEPRGLSRRDRSNESDTCSHCDATSSTPKRRARGLRARAHPRLRAIQPTRQPQSRGVPQHPTDRNALARRPIAAPACHRAAPDRRRLPQPPGGFPRRAWQGPLLCLGQTYRDRSLQLGPLVPPLATAAGRPRRAGQDHRVRPGPAGGRVTRRARRPRGPAPDIGTALPQRRGGDEAPGQVRGGTGPRDIAGLAKYGVELVAEDADSAAIRKTIKADSGGSARTSTFTKLKRANLEPGWYHLRVVPLNSGGVPLDVEAPANEGTLPLNESNRFFVFDDSELDEEPEQPEVRRAIGVTQELTRLRFEAAGQDRDWKRLACTGAHWTGPDARAIEASFGSGAAPAFL